MQNSVSILVTGSEVLDGRVADTNSSWLIEVLTARGISVANVLSCTDSLEAIKDCLCFLAKRSSVIILSGGLGPTSDDLTREALSELAAVPLVQSQEALADLENFLKRRGRELSGANLKQSFIPQGAHLIRNPVGTAACFALPVQFETGRSALVLALPGVPLELKRITEESVLPILSEQFSTNQPLRKRGARIFGLPEALVGERVEASSPDSGIVVSYRAAFPEIHLLLKCEPEKVSEESLDTSFERACQAIGSEFIFSADLDISLAQATHTLLAKRRETLALAESCTGGLLAKLLSDNPGSSEYLLGAAVSYANSAKQVLLGVSAELIEQQGAVSFEVAKAMAQGARSRLGSAFAVSVTGIAGPTGGTAEKPVGTFFLGFAAQDELEAYRCLHVGDRERVRQFAAYKALDLLRRKFLKLPLDSIGERQA